MPGPDPKALFIEEADSGRRLMCFELWGRSGRAQREARAARVQRNLLRDGWACALCGGPVPYWRRADAIYCSAGCKQRAHYSRGKIPSAASPQPLFGPDKTQA